MSIDDLKAAQKRIEELEQNSCGDCLEYEDDGTPYTAYGWNENREEGQIPCGCISESGPYQILEKKYETLFCAISTVLQWSEFEHLNCPNCGHAEPMKDCDYVAELRSAIEKQV